MPVSYISDDYDRNPFVEGTQKDIAIKAKESKGGQIYYVGASGKTYADVEASQPISVIPQEPEIQDVESGQQIKQTIAKQDQTRTFGSRGYSPPPSAPKATDETGQQAAQEVMAERTIERQEKKLKDEQKELSKLEKTARTEEKKVVEELRRLNRDQERYQKTYIVGDKRMSFDEYKRYLETQRMDISAAKGSLREYETELSKAEKSIKQNKKSLEDYRKKRAEAFMPSTKKWVLSQAENKESKSITGGIMQFLGNAFSDPSITGMYAKGQKYEPGGSILKRAAETVIAPVSVAENIPFSAAFAVTALVGGDTKELEKYRPYEPTTDIGKASKVATELAFLTDAGGYSWKASAYDDVFKYSDELFDYSGVLAGVRKTGKGQYDVYALSQKPGFKPWGKGEQMTGSIVKVKEVGKNAFISGGVTKTAGKNIDEALQPLASFGGRRFKFKDFSESISAFATPTKTGKTITQIKSLKGGGIFRGASKVDDIINPFVGGYKIIDDKVDDMIKFITPTAKTKSKSIIDDLSNFVKGAGTKAKGTTIPSGKAAGIIKEALPKIVSASAKQSKQANVLKNLGQITKAGLAATSFGISRTKTMPQIDDFIKIDRGRARTLPDIKLDVSLKNMGIEKNIPAASIGLKSKEISKVKPISALDVGTAEFSGEQEKIIDLTSTETGTATKTSISLPPFGIGTPGLGWPAFDFGGFPNQKIGLGKVPKFKNIVKKVKWGKIL